MKKLFKKLKLKKDIKKVNKMSESLDTQIDAGLCMIMLKCKLLLDDKQAPDKELRNMVKEVGTIISEKEDVDNKLEKLGTL